MSIIKVKLFGGFHNADVTHLFIKDDKLSTGQYKRIAQHFCSFKGCVCGGVRRADKIGIDYNLFANMIEDAAYEAYKQRLNSNQRIN